MVSPRGFVPLFFFLLVFTLIVSFSSQPVDALIWNRPTLVVADLNVNSTDYWDTGDHGPMRNVGNISHSWLDDLAWSVAGHTIDTDFLPDSTLSYDIGSGASRWRWLYVQNISSDYGDFAYDVNIDGDLQVDGIMNVTNMTIKNMWIVNMIATGNISTDANFVGDGSELTGIESGIWTNVSNTATFEGNANVTGNVTIGTGLIWHNGTHLILRG